MVRKLIGQILVERNLISFQELHNALALQRERNEKVGRILLDLGYLAERDLIQAIIEQHQAPLITAAEFPAVPIEVQKLSYKFMKQFKLLPLDLEGNVLTLAMSDPADTETLESVRLFTGNEVKVRFALEDEITEALDRFYGAGNGNTPRVVEEQAGQSGLDYAGGEEDIEHLRDMASEAPVIRLVNVIISRAVERRASDIHIEPFEKEFRIRYRIDGILQNVESPPVHLKAAIISRLKLMAKLNIAERRLPQDGRIKLKVLGKEIDLRVSTLPTLYGESVVMRILDKSDSSAFDLRRLGFSEELLRKIEVLTSLPHGILLVTGPTGSGKSTTLYSAMKRINLPDKKIITIEDPVEYQMDGINQIHVNTQIGLTFASGLRHIVRQDPDVIMIGEIRDLETAEIAIRSALTGHLVFSTLHTNDAPSAITRLVDMGAENYLLSSCLIGVLAQRLVRIICKQCQFAYTAGPEALQALGFDEKWSTPLTLHRGEGCESCGYTGYESRKGIFELMIPDDEIRRMIVANEPSNIIANYAHSRGMTTLREDGVQKVLAGVTTVDEVMRVTQDV